jgi:hypothetical protein
MGISDCELAGSVIFCLLGTASLATEALIVIVPQIVDLWHYLVEPQSKRERKTGKVLHMRYLKMVGTNEE